MKTAGQTLGELFCRRLVDSMPSPQARTICLLELQKWSGKTLYMPATKHKNRREQVARHMIDNGMCAADAALAIHERFGVTMRTAQRDVKTCCRLSRE